MVKRVKIWFLLKTLRWEPIIPACFDDKSHYYKWVSTIQLQF